MRAIIPEGAGPREISIVRLTLTQVIWRAETISDKR
jgi:hypothetical protein